MNRVLAASLIVLTLLTGCAQSPDTSSVEEPIAAPAPEKGSVETEVAPPTPQVTTEIYNMLDEICGTNLASGAVISGSATSKMANALFIGLKSMTAESLDCVLRETQAGITVADFEPGVEASASSASHGGIWEITGNISPLGDDAMLTVNLYFMPVD